ncbi:MAG: archease [Candidatus Hodarchaeales archaeon]|jgi:SHS2 domain-containing protein
MSFRYLDDLTSDVAFEARGESLEELLATVAKAMLNIMYDLDEVEPAKSLFVSITGDDAEHLLHRWLSELLFQFEVENMHFCEFRDISIRPTSDGLSVEGELWGEEADPTLMKTHVKGVTYHKFSVRQEKASEWVATVVVDI